MSDDTALKAIRDAIGNQWAELKKEFDKQEADRDGVREAKIQKLNDSLTELGAKLEKAEKAQIEDRHAREDVERKLNHLRGRKNDDVDPALELKSFNDLRRSYSTEGARVDDITQEHFDAYKSAFERMCRKGEKLLSPDEIKALSAGSDADGGYLLPPADVGRVVTRVRDLSPIRQISNVQQISGARLEGVNDLDEAGYGWTSEAGTRSETTTPQVGKWAIEAFEMYAAPKATQTLIDDSAVPIEGWLGAKVADRFARVEGAAFVSGTGVGQPKGFTSYTTAATADESRTWGQFEHVVTGSNSGFHTTQADPLFDLVQKFKPAWLQRAVWVTTRGAIGAIRKFKTTTTLEYIWQPGLQKGQPDTLLGYPIVIAQDMTAHTTQNALCMALGDFTEGYQIVDRIGIRTLRDPYTSKPYVIFYSTMRVGGGAINFDAIKFIKTST